MRTGLTTMRSPRNNKLCKKSLELMLQIRVNRVGFPRHQITPAHPAAATQYLRCASFSQQHHPCLLFLCLPLTIELVETRREIQAGNGCQGERNHERV